MPHELKKKMKAYPNWPKNGVVFRDIMSLLRDSEAFNRIVDLLVERYKENKPEMVVGIESRGFIIGSVLAHKLNVGFVPVRKPGKLPGEIISEEYELEYGKDKVEIQTESIKPGMKILIVDDLVATAGTCLATANLIKKLGGDIIECCFVIELLDLKGRDKLEKAGYKVFSLLQFEGD